MPMDDPEPVTGATPLKSRLDRHGGEGRVTDVSRPFSGSLPSHQSLREERLIIKSLWIIQPSPVQEKVVCFKQLGIDPKLLPKRIYAGRANGRIRYFHIKMPVAVEQDRAIFAYIDPGMSTRSLLHC